MVNCPTRAHLRTATFWGVAENTLTQDYAKVTSCKMAEGPP